MIVTLWDWGVLVCFHDQTEFRCHESCCIVSAPVVPNFAQKVEGAVDALSRNPQRDVDDNEFIDASRLVYDGVRDIRRAVLMNRVCPSHNALSVPIIQHSHCIPPFF